MYIAVEIFSFLLVLCAVIMACFAWKRLYTHLDAPGVKMTYFSIISIVALIVFSLFGSSLLGVMFLWYLKPLITIATATLFLTGAYGLLKLSKHFKTLNLRKEGQIENLVEPMS